MSTSPDENDSTDTLQPLEEPGQLGVERVLTYVERTPGVEVEVRSNAYCCGAHGCRADESLAYVRIDGFGKRVLCPTHLIILVDQEVGLDG